MARRNPRPSNRISLPIKWVRYRENLSNLGSFALAQQVKPCLKVSIVNEVCRFPVGFDRRFLDAPALTANFPPFRFTDDRSLTTILSSLLATCHLPIRQNRVRSPARFRLLSS